MLILRKTLFTYLMYDPIYNFPRLKYILGYNRIFKAVILFQEITSPLILM